MKGILRAIVVNIEIQESLLVFKNLASILSRENDENHEDDDDWGSYWYFSPRASIRSFASLRAHVCTLVSGL